MLTAMVEHGQRRHSLRTRLGLVALVFLAMVVAAVITSVVMVRSWDQTVDRRGATRLAAEDVSEIRLAYSDQETGIRGFLLTDDSDFLEPYRDGVGVRRRVTDRLIERDIAIAGFDEQLDVVLAAGERWRQDVALPAVSGEMVDEELSLAVFDDLRAELDTLDALVTAELVAAEQDADRMRRNLFAVLAASAVIAIAGTLFAAALFRRWVIRPLATIRDTARALIVDDTHPLPEFESSELQDVSDAVGTLQRSLRTARDEAVAALDGIEQSAVLAIQVRSELADEIGDMPDGWAVNTLLVPAEGMVAGDCFDVGLLDAQHIYVVLIDVTGHGAPAALNALKAKSQLRAALRRRRDPGMAIDWLSGEMLKDEHADLLTVAVMVVHLSTGRIRYASAGHPPALLTDGTEVVPLEGGGPLVGAFATNWTTSVADLEPGWTVLLHTDGVTDALGHDRERFGEDRLRECLDVVEPTALLERIQDAVDGFSVERSDDLTAIAIHRVAASEENAADAVAAAGDTTNDSADTLAVPTAT